jgi:cellulose synthase (UDP-forming)
VPLTPGKESAKDVKTEVALPVVNLRPFSNSLSFDLAFQLQKKGGCQDTTPINMIGSVLRDSYLDLRGFPHWAALPNLELFSNAGFPFTRMADLRETTVVLPPVATPQEIELYLTLLGHFGAQTGYPALRVTVADADSMKPGADTDFLVLGTVQDQPAIEKLSSSLPVVLNSDGLKIQDEEGFFAPLHRAWWKMKTTDQSVSGELSASGTPDSVIEGLESPYLHGRSVLLVAVKDPSTFEPLMSNFLKTSQSGDISGSVAVLHGVEFQSYRIRNSVYHVGNLPWWTAVSLWVMQVPWILALAVLAISFILAVWTRTWLRGRARARLQISEG